MEKIEELILKSTQLFIREQKENLNKVIKTLFKFRIHKSKDCELELKRFFHLIKGTASTLRLERLSKIGEEYENYLDNIENSGDSFDEVVSHILKGLACIYEEVEILYGQYISNKNENIDMHKNEICRNLDKGNICIVDDDIIILRLLEDVFCKEGYNVITCLNPDDVITILKKKRIDLIILDLVMPQKDGFETLTQIRKNKFNTPIIFLTAQNITEDKVKALNAGADDYITKPFQIEELVARVESIVKKFNNYKKQIITDNLVGVYNKEFFFEQMIHLKEGLSNKTQKFSIAFIDLDHFKSINDKHGHLAGDYILKIFIQELKEYLRDTDEIYRYGGDEFLILFKNTSGKNAYEALERVQNNVRLKEFYYKDNDENIQVSFSAGISSVLEEDKSVEDIIERADKALYVSKKSGRGRITCYEKYFKNNNKKILIIDDSTVIAHMIKNKLSSLNYFVACANDGEKGLEVCNEVKPNLIILDLVLPKLDGFEVCRRIKNNVDTKDTKIIILTSSCKEDNIMKCLKLGADDYMIKPFSLDDLQERVEKMINM